MNTHHFSFEYAKR